MFYSILQASLLRTFANVPANRISRAPAERARLYFLLAWFNAVVQERLRYVPLGWSKRYEFNESDLKVACDTIDTWVDMAALGRSNLSPDKVPWSALRTLLGQCIYGGKIDNLFDQRLLETFLSVLFTESSFEVSHYLYIFSMLPLILFIFFMYLNIPTYKTMFLHFSEFYTTVLTGFGFHYIV